MNLVDYINLPYQMRTILTQTIMLTNNTHTIPYQTAQTHHMTKNRPYHKTPHP